MIEIAIKMLMGDRVKYIVLVSSIMLSTFLVMIQSSILMGSMRLINAYIINTTSPIWVVDRQVPNTLDLIDMSNTNLNIVKSVQGVKSALPLSITKLYARAENGEYALIDLIGVDTQSLYGIPSNVLKGNIANLWQADSVVVDQFFIERFMGINIVFDVGDIIYVNDHAVKIVAIVKGEPSAFAPPAVYTTFNRVLEISPPKPKNLNAILVTPQEGVPIYELVKRIEDKTGLAAYSSSDLALKSILWFFDNSPLPLSFLATCLIGLGVGILVASQTFYSFVEANSKNFAALKAMGAGSSVEKQMLLSQTFMIGIVGYCLGSAISAIIAWWLKHNGISATVLPWQLFVMVFFVIMIALLFSVYFSIRRVSKIQPAEVFRG